jgi:hypothetical protein
MIIVRDSRRTIGDALQLLVQSEDELRERKVLAGVSANAHLGYDGGWKEGGASSGRRRSYRHLRDGIVLTYPSYSHPHRPLSNAHVHNAHLCYTESTTNQRPPSQRQRLDPPYSPHPVPRCSILIFSPVFPALRHLVSRRRCLSAIVRTGYSISG